MSNEIFVKRSIEVLPKEEGFYFVYWRDQCKSSAYFYRDGSWSFDESKNYVAHWLEPITVEQYLSEHPEKVETIRKEGFCAARREKEGLEDCGWPSHHLVFETAKDYIDSLKQTQHEQS